MEYPNVITHGDADGIVCLALFLKKFGSLRCKIQFSSSFKLKNSICNAVMKSERLKELYIFDIAASKLTLTLASAFEKVVWIDHHLWPELELPPNIEALVDEKSPSAAQLVGKYFGIESELIQLANEIDRNNARSERAIFLRDLVAAMRWKHGGKLSMRLRALARDLAFSGIERFERDRRIAELLNKYREWVKKIEEGVLQKTKIFELNGRKIAVFETLSHIPIYIVNNKLLEHEQAPFDLVAILIHRFNAQSGKIGTKIGTDTIFSVIH